MVKLRRITINKLRDFLFYILFFLAVLLNKILKSPPQIQKLPLNLNSFKLETGDVSLGSFFWNFIEHPAEKGSFSIKEYDEKNDRVKVVNLQTFSWLFVLSSVNNKKARDFTKAFMAKAIFLGKRYSRKVWELETAGSRLSAICLNMRFLDLSETLIDRRMMISFIRFHVIYLTLCNAFFPRGLISLKVNSSIFFASLILGETLAKRHRILRWIIKDSICLLGKDGEIKSRNSAELLEVLFLVNRVIRFSSTAELSRGKLDRHLKNVQSKIAPVLRGLRLGSGQLFRAYGSGGETTQWNLDRELFDAKLSDFSVRKRSMGFHRITAGRLRLIFDGKSGNTQSQLKNFSCSAFSFELTSGQRTIFQNNVPFNFFLGHSDSISKISHEYNSIQVSLADTLSEISRWSVTNIGVKDYRNHENYYLEGEKVISRDHLNLAHRRKLIIPMLGTGIIGRDLISITSGKLEEYGPARVQFFLHPDVEVWKTKESNYFLLQMKNKEVWNFETDKNNGFLETYNYLDPIDLQEKKAFSIVLERNITEENLPIDWRLSIQSHSNRITREKANF